MNFGMVARVLGNLLLIEAAFLSIPLGISVYYQERGAILGFLLAMGIMGLIGLFLANVKSKSSRLKAREAILIVTLGWTLTSFFAALPFVLSGSVPNLADAFFEATSSLTTTGSTVIPDVESLPKGVLFWRSFAHWLGGMGILVLTLAILPSLGVGGLQIFKAESPGPSPDKFTPRIVATTKILYTIYLALTIVQSLVFRWSGLSLFDSLVLAFGTVSTGGLAVYNDSLMRYGSNNFLVYAVAIGMIMSGVNFSLYYDLWQRRFKQVTVNSEFRLYLAILLVAVVLVSIGLYGKVYESLGETIKQSLFQVSSIMTTTGYTTADYDRWPSFSKGVLFLLMFVGGSAGSTAGGVKVIRLLVAAKVVRREIAKTLHPQAMTPIIINGRVASSEVVQGVTSFYLLYLAVFVIGSLLISLEGLDPFSSMSAVAATLGNIGPGFGNVGPTATFAMFSPFSKLLLSFLMLVGRLELFTLLVILTPSFWRE
ncbi:MAG TPA: TrkH family potassium uptake protein [Firmicutes bacterium]|jgi:trk system potassium uptake protein TrkH|nr:TrkH family potassium uptake protein [Bacillota bacterium]